MLTSGPSGFYNAPVTKASLLTVGLASLLVTLTNTRSSYHFQLSPHLLTHSQYWRLFTSPLFFSTSSEILLGGILLYHSRLLERHWGSFKYVSFVAFATVFQSIAQLLLSVIFSPTKRFASGPYGWIFASIFIFARDIPPLYHINVIGLKMSDKIFVYLLASQLLLSSYSSVDTGSSFWPSVFGLVAGMVYKAFPNTVGKWRVPIVLKKWTKRVVDPWLTSVDVARANHATRNVTPMVDASGLGGGSIGGFGNPLATSGASTGTSYASAAASANVNGGNLTQRNMPVYEPVEEDIARLVEMGFERDAVIGALRRSQGNVEVAVASLFSDS